jgi:hypothetical protein
MPSLSLRITGMAANGRPEQSELRRTQARHMLPLGRGGGVGSALLRGGNLYISAVQIMLAMLHFVPYINTHGRRGAVQQLERNMTTASDILHISANANDADTRAQAVTDKIDQDWENEATLYTFDDDSVLVSSGGQLNAYATMTEAREALAA